MKELQGAIIIGSAFQAFLGYSGLMSLILRYTLLPHFLLNSTLFVLTDLEIKLCQAMNLDCIILL